VLSESYVKEGLEKTDALDSMLEMFSAAELPYLKGIEVLPMEESRRSLAAADEACQVVGAAISTARTVIASKHLEIKKFDIKSAKASIEEFAKLTERANSAAQKLGVFKKDTESRRKKAQLVEAGEMVTAVEAEVAKVGEAVKPFMEKDPDTLSPEEASTMVKALADIEKSAAKQLNDCRNFLAARSRDAAGEQDKVKLVQELQTKLSAQQAELAKTKKLSSTHNEKFERRP